MCDCIAKANAALADKNTRITQGLAFKAKDMSYNGVHIFIATEKVSSRRRVGPVRIGCTFCPLCGERLVPER